MLIFRFLKEKESCHVHIIQYAARFLTMGYLNPTKPLSLHMIASRFWIPWLKLWNTRDGHKQRLTRYKPLKKHNTWRTTELPSGKKTIGCRWIFTIKHRADRSIERLKAWLAAKGYTQSCSIDYKETFSPVVNLNTVRILLSIAVSYDWNLHQLDIKKMHS